MSVAPELLSINQVAERLNISRSAAYELVHGECRHGALRIGRTIRMDAAFLSAWVERQKGHIDPPVPGRAAVRR